MFCSVLFVYLFVLRLKSQFVFDLRVKIRNKFCKATNSNYLAEFEVELNGSIENTVIHAQNISMSENNFQMEFNQFIKKNL